MKNIKGIKFPPKDMLNMDITINRHFKPKKVRMPEDIKRMFEKLGWDKDGRRINQD